MLETKTIKDIRPPADSVKDTIKDKAEKLAAAVYLVTNFLTDLDQIKWKLRDKSLNLKVKLTVGGVSSVLPVEMILSDIKEIISLIDIAVLDRHASIMNFSILREGYLGLQTEFQSYLDGDWYKQAFMPIAINNPQVSHSKEVGLPLGSAASKNVSTNNSRREKIISFIKQHNWSATKEIAKFIPEVGSKTIQRELAELVRTGALKKTGERRWSRYSLTG